MKKFLSISLLMTFAIFNIFVLSACNRTISDSASNTSISDRAKTKDWEGLAKALTTNGAKMYGATWCNHCQEQKAAFGKAVKYITYIECSDPDNPYRQASVCETANIKGYPTWEFSDGSREVGLMTYAELAQKVGFTGD